LFARTEATDDRIEAADIHEAAQHAPQVRRDAHVAVVQADDNVAAALHEGGDRLEALPWKARVMQDTAAIHEVEALRLEDRPEQIHLVERRAIQLVCIAEFASELQRVGRETHAEYLTLRHGEIEGELPGAAAHLEHARTERQRLLKRSRKDALLGPVDQAADGVGVFIVGE